MYPVCVVADEVVCYDTREVRGWRFCGEAPGEPAGGIFTKYNAPLRFQGFRECNGEWCLVVSGRADRKEVVRNEQGVAIATGLVSDSGTFRDGMEPMDNNNPSTCTFALVVN